MPFIPHTDDDIKAMLKRIGESSIENLFDEIPKNLRAKSFNQVPEGTSELGLNQLASQRAAAIDPNSNFIGAGAYEHHIPACVWDIAFRGEFLTAYTPYQAEASQGSLQLIYEFQTMMASLTGMDVANASMYDGSSALAEAVLMAVRANRKVKTKRILILGALHPHYADTTRTIVCGQDIELINVGYDKSSGTTPLDALSAYANEEVAAIVIQQPNFFGCLETVDELTNWAHDKNALVIAVVNPMAMALIKPPGEWGEKGADITCGEGQPLGIPLASGGPYFGFMTTTKALVRHLPGRIVGRTVDQDGKEGFTLTLQAREQHIRRSKATSNICTNQGLLVTGATIYMSVMGFEGLKRTALVSHQNTTELVTALSRIKGVSVTYNSPYFHEVSISLPKSAETVCEEMSRQGINAGLPLNSFDSSLANDLLVCVTETKTPEDIQAYVTALTTVLAEG